MLMSPRTIGTRTAVAAHGPAVTAMPGLAWVAWHAIVSVVAASLAVLLIVGQLVPRPAFAGQVPAQADVEAAVSRTLPGTAIAWTSVHIGAGRPASAGEASRAGMPWPVTVYPVLAAYTKTGGFKRDVIWNYYVYQGDSGDWIAASNAIPGNVESEPY